MQSAVISLPVWYSAIWLLADQHHAMTKGCRFGVACKLSHDHAAQSQPPKSTMTAAVKKEIVEQKFAKPGPDFKAWMASKQAQQAAQEVPRFEAPPHMPAPPVAAAAKVAAAASVQRLWENAAAFKAKAIARAATSKAKQELDVPICWKAPHTPPLAAAAASSPEADAAAQKKEKAKARASTKAVPKGQGC